MNRDNRVLSRKNARELTVDETAQVYGALRTGILCSAPIPPNTKPDGSPLDC
jgi:hypothetical protein